MLLVYEKSPKTDKPVERVAEDKRRNKYAYMDNLLEKKQAGIKNKKSLTRLYGSIGLFLSLLIVVGAFNWKVYDTKEVELLAVQESVDELLDIPLTEQPPPPPPKNTVQQPSIIEVPDEEEIIEEINVDFDVEITADETLSEVDYSAVEMPPEEKADEIFTIVEQNPTPKMGMQAFLEFLYENIHYPQRALRVGIQGKVFVQFVVNADGTLTDFVVIKGIGGGCDEEAIRVLEMAEPWNPGKQRGKPVRVRMVLPVHFVYKDRV